ncbi:hypothetical protein HPB51_028887 [Rhipicephalus microplus]|uniref:Uncharacterized protein n=1 Tax=Rhipicephalus microplus TaxID=6941 RepID=A0A9J6CW92_RHIMP|nr:hypothetical protein HPB51_028887 [Rhipicephalus microplus]
MAFKSEFLVERRHAPDEVPTILPNLPAYLTLKTPALRTLTKRRHQCVPAENDNRKQRRISTPAQLFVDTNGATSADGDEADEASSSPSSDAVVTLGDLRGLVLPSKSWVLHEFPGFAGVSRLPGHAHTIRAPVRPQAGPPGPFKSTKRCGAALTLTRRACTSTMQRPAQHSTPTTTDVLSVSPASSRRTADTAVPPLSTSGDVTSPAPTTIQQQAAFLNSAHGPATCNAGGVSATLSLIATETPEPENRNAALALQSATPAALPTLSASGLPIGNSESVHKCVSTSVVLSIAEVLPSIPLADDLSTEMDFTASQVNEDNTPSPEGSWNTVSANRKPASTTLPRSELITVGIQLPPGTLTPKLPLYNVLSTIIAAANLSPKTSAEGTVLINAPNTAFRPSAAAVRLLYQQIPMLTFAPNPGASIAKSTPTHLSITPAPTL